MDITQIITSATQNANEFYKCEAKNLLISHCLGESCFKLVCFDLSCGCQQTQRCDLEEGETVKTAHPDAIEISKEEFITMFTTCYLEFHKQNG